MPQDIPYALEIPRVTLTKAVGPEEVARLALTVAKSHLGDAELRAGSSQRLPGSTRQAMETVTK
jgi:hypothetical protein